MALEGVLEVKNQKTNNNRIKKIIIFLSISKETKENNILFLG